MNLIEKNRAIIDAYFVEARKYGVDGPEANAILWRILTDTSIKKYPRNGCELALDEIKAKYYYVE